MATETCPPCNHNCRQGRDCPARKKTMPAPTDLAAALLRDVPRFNVTVGDHTDPSVLLLETEVLAALSAHLDGVTERAGEVLPRLRKADEYEPLGHDGWEAADLITALLAQNTALRAERDELTAAIDSIETSHGLTSNGNLWRFWSKKAREYIDSCDRDRKAAEAEVEKLRGAIRELKRCWYQGDLTENDFRAALTTEERK